MHKFNPRKNLSADQSMIDSIYLNVKDDSNIKNIIQGKEGILGEFLIVPQSCLTFGKSRNIPVNKRPAISLMRNFTGIYVCPCSSKYGKDKFNLPHNHVNWYQQDSKYKNSYVFWQYERILDVMVMLKGKCVGRIDSYYRDEITRWLIDRHSRLCKSAGVR